MSSDAHELEQRLARLTGRQHCVLTSRATAALYLAFAALSRGPGRIVLPAILCPSPAYAVLYAGHQPLFCDVDPETGNIAPAALDELLGTTPNVTAVVPTHLYGQPADMNILSAIAARHRVPIIEDGAQALGAQTADDKPVGGSGTCSILSFGHTKIIDAGYGGALVTDDGSLADDIRSAAGQLADPGPDRAALAAQYRDDYYRIRAAAEHDPAANDEYLDFPERFRPLYLDRFDASRAGDILHALDGLDQTVVARRRKAATYDEILGATGITSLRRDARAVPWRYGVRIAPGVQRRVTEGLRDAGFDASNWYPSLHRWFDAGRERQENTLKNALAHESSVLNLWLDDATPDERVDACARSLAGLLSHPDARSVTS